jgi:sugar lactone lactonase YvrE
MQRSRGNVLGILAALLTAAATNTAVFAHPGSGIVVDLRGQVFFIDTGQGVWRIDAQGRLAQAGGPAFHWLAIDVTGRFARTRLPSSPIAEMKAVGTDPTLIVSSDYPVTVGRDGALYYPEPGPEPGKDRRLRIYRVTPSGARTVFATLPAATESGPLQWLNGIASGPDGSIYYTENRAVRRITSQGTLSTLVANATVPGCVWPPAWEARLGPYFRGLDVDPSGTVFVAATGCSAVLKVEPAGKISVVSRADRPWSPTAVALRGKELYVLEYLHTAAEDRRAWVPRVRMVSPDGTAVLVAAVERR